MYAIRIVNIFDAKTLILLCNIIPYTNVSLLCAYKLQVAFSVWSLFEYNAPAVLVVLRRLFCENHNT